jgi:peptidoglycan-associated lipoprotein
MRQCTLLKTVVAAALVIGTAGACSSAPDAAGQAGGAAQNAAGQAGGAAGSKIQELVQVHPVTFTAQSAELTGQDTQTLQQVAAVQKATGATVTISTHAGYPDAAQAQQLSQQRAENIAKAMQAAGADASKLKTEPAGNSVGQGDEALQTQISAS